MGDLSRPTFAQFFVPECFSQDFADVGLGKLVTELHGRGQLVFCQPFRAEGDAVGQPVRIGALEADWHGLNPRVTLRDVRMIPPAGAGAPPARNPPLARPCFRGSPLHGNKEEPPCSDR